MTTRADLMALWRQRGAMAYDGEGVSQLQHGWQCARLARQADAPVPLQVAAWLHDIGHLLAGLPGTPTLAGVDDGHERLGAAWLQGLYGPSVARPVALHVAAKRCLVASQPGYQDALSADSRRSLQLQGGPMDEAEVARFMALPHAGDALKLRLWDDQAKNPALRPVHDELALAELTALLAAMPG